MPPDPLPPDRVLWTTPQNWQLTVADWSRIEWRDEVDLGFLSMAPDRRQCRLFAVACCRAIWDRLGRRDRDVVELAERLADGLVTDDEADIHRRDILRRVNGGVDGWDEWWTATEARSTLSHAIHEHCNTYFLPEFLPLFLDVFGPKPFAMPPFEVRWRTADTVPIAAAMYESRDFADIGYLADALEDAGCADAEVLGHCRGPGPHARGCWVVDGVLGK